MNQHFLFFQQFRNAEQVADITVEKKMETKWIKTIKKQVPWQYPAEYSILKRTAVIITVKWEGRKLKLPAFF